MTVLLQVDFPSDGPWGHEMADAYRELAHSITEEPGFVQKIWTENEEEGIAGGIYLFESEETARAYLEMHSKRLGEWGVTDIRGRVFQVNPELSAITNWRGAGA
ncbi:monooxygenase [Corynebacterium sp. 335C]